jgi:indolepyruvate ferredoxin oxidoreductase, alpha subunit
MKDMGEMLLTTAPFSEIVMGNTALVRAMIETETRVITSYPGSPTPEIATAIQTIPLARRPFYFQFSTNEKVAVEVALGASLNGHLSAVFFKSVGLNVAADSFVQLSLLHLIGGMVIILGDDPGANSSQNEQDNRHYARMSYTPILEPASPTEAYSFYKEAANLAKDMGKAIILRLTTHVCHAKERVAFCGWTPPVQPDHTGRFDAANGPYIPLVSQVFPKKRKALEDLQLVEQRVEERKLHRLVANNSSRGIIVSGMVYLSVEDVLAPLADKPDILKLAMIYPLPAQAIIDFLAAHSEVKVLEELDDTLEKDVKALAFDHRLPTKVVGKTTTEDWIGEYIPDKVHDILHSTWPEHIPARKISAPDNTTPISARPPQMCPGCGHRSAFHAIKQALPEGTITVADIGCHTLGFQEPYKMGEVLLCMGASTAIASGLSLFNTSRRVVAFLGDSTFFHAGIPGIINALFNRHSVTLVLMENGTTAMTGHQDHAGSGRNFNEVTEAIPVRRVLAGLGVKHVFETDAYKQEELAAMVRQAVALDSFSVVIARHPCMLLFARNQRKKSGFLPHHVRIDQDQCGRIHTCIEEFGCPSFARGADGSVTVNRELCIGDGSCMQTCPTTAITR